jgi:hypothetical protein
VTFNLQAVLLAAIFACQIVVLSFYAPQRWRRHYAMMFERYPPEQFPRLYPLPKEAIERKLAIFRVTHLAIGIGAAVAFFAALIFAKSPQWFAISMGQANIWQAVVLLCMAWWPLGLRIRKAFRAMPPPSPRSAELRQWRVTDFVSPLCIGLGLSLQTLGLACAVVVYLSWLNTHTILPLVLTTVIGGWLLWSMIRRLFSPQGSARPDPYMSGADTFRVRQRHCRVLFGAGAFWGAFQAFFLLYNAQLIRFDFAYLYAGLSVVLQLWALLLVSNEDYDFDTRDFSVYRAGSGTQTAP